MGQRRSEVPWGAPGAGMRGEAGGQHRVSGKGTVVGTMEQKPGIAELHRHRDASLGRSCLGAVIPKSRTARSCSQEKVEEISVMGENPRATIPGHPLGASRPGPPCQLPNTQRKHELLAPRGPSCNPAGTVRRRKQSLLQAIPRWWSTML